MESTFAQNIWGKKVGWSSIWVKGSQNYSDVAQKKCVGRESINDKQKGLWLDAFDFLELQS